jgi:hypothetical protein
VRNEIARQAGRQFDPIICESLLAPANWKGMVDAIGSSLQPSPGRKYSSVMTSGRTSDSIAAMTQK